MIFFNRLENINKTHSKLLLKCIHSILYASLTIDLFYLFQFFCDHIDKIILCKKITVVMQKNENAIIKIVESFYSNLFSVNKDVSEIIFKTSIHKTAFYYIHARKRRNIANNPWLININVRHLDVFKSFS